MIEEIKKIDSSFDETIFISVVNNIFIMILSSLMDNDLDKVRHFISKDLEKKYEDKLNELNSRNVSIMYEMPNIKSSEIVGFSVENDKYIIKVDLVSKYIEYEVDSNMNPLGDVPSDRIEKVHHLVLEKKINTKCQPIARYCPNCGANISINTSGKCKYCGSIYNQEEYGFVLKKMD